MAATREERIRARLFPGVKTFTRKGFTTLPIILRRAQFLFSARSWQVYTYVLMRTGKVGVAWLTMTEMAFDLDFNSTAKLRKYVEGLVADGWLATKRSTTREYFIAPDPYAVLKALDQAGRIPPERREELDELLELLDQEALSAPPAQPAAAAAPVRASGWIMRGGVPRRPPAPLTGASTPGAMSPEEFKQTTEEIGLTESTAAPSRSPAEQELDELLGQKPGS